MAQTPQILTTSSQARETTNTTLRDQLSLTTLSYHDEMLI
jgi:hypothetical protein